MNEKVKMIRAMETIARNLNDEELVQYWLMLGVSDGDITDDTTDEEIDDMYDDHDLKEFMNVFFKLMKYATEGECSGTFYCNGFIN